MSAPVELEDVRKAAEAIRGALAETPCLPSRTLSEIAGAELHLKFENLQFTASFKERGALNRLLALGDAERARGVIAMSSGNHAQAVAYHARRLGIPATIVMPRTTPTPKVEHTRAFGAEVILHGEGLDEAAARARELAAERGLTLVHPYDDPQVIAGQGTIALEMLAAAPELDALVIPIGGGGLIAGNAIAARALRPGLEVIGVETRAYPSMRQALEGLPIRCGTGTLADGIAVKEPGRITREIVREKVDEILLVDDLDVERAILLLLEVEKTVAEGAGAAPRAAVLRHRRRFAGRRVGLVVSGGNIEPFLLASIIQRGLVRSGRLVRVHVGLRDRPGSLAALTASVSRTDASIVEVRHQRSFSALPVQEADVELMLRTRGRDHLEEILAALRADGFEPHVSPADLAVLERPER